MESQNKHPFKLVDLQDFTSLRLGGPARLFQPRSLDALVETLKGLREQRQRYHLLGNGSNLLVNDAGLEAPVIHTGLLKSMRFEGPYVEVEAGCLLPKLLRAACKEYLGGIEYLVSVPGTVGGGICMNAGRGEHYQRFLHQVVESVTCFDGHRTWHFRKNDLGTDFRWSIFRNNPDLCIISAILRLDKCSPATIRQRISERLRLTRSREDHSGPNAGSVFRVRKDCSAFRGRHVGGIRFSERTPNWIVNEGGTFQEVLDLVHSVGTDQELEWDVWKD